MEFQGSSEVELFRDKESSDTPQTLPYKWLFSPTTPMPPRGKELDQTVEIIHSPCEGCINYRRVDKQPFYLFEGKRETVEKIVFAWAITGNVLHVFCIFFNFSQHSKTKKKVTIPTS